MRPGETLIDMARRHVAEGEAHVRKQRELVARLDEDAAIMAEAKALLVEFEQSLTDHRASLRRIEHEQRLGLRDAAGHPIGR